MQRSFLSLTTFREFYGWEAVFGKTSQQGGGKNDEGGEDGQWNLVGARLIECPPHDEGTRRARDGVSRSCIGVQLTESAEPEVARQ